MPRFFKKAWVIIKKTYVEFQAHDPIVYAAAIAFFTVFSLPSVLIIIVRVMGAILGEEAVQEQLSSQIEELVGSASSSNDIKKIIDNRAIGASNWLFNAIGIVFLLFSATVVFTFTQKALNAIWDVKPKPNMGVIKFAKDKLLSLSIIIVLGLLMLAFFIIDAMLGVFRGYISEIFSTYTVDIIRFASGFSSFVVISFIFALVFKFLPDAEVHWKDVAVGALVTGILFEVGRYLISLLLSKTTLVSAYGAAGSLAGILIWVFYSSVLVLVGATFTKVYAIYLGGRIAPDKNSVRVELREVEKEKGGKSL